MLVMVLVVVEGGFSSEGCDRLTADGNCDSVPGIGSGRGGTADSANTAAAAAAAPSGNACGKLSVAALTGSGLGGAAKAVSAGMDWYGEAPAAAAPAPTAAAPPTPASNAACAGGDAGSCSPGVVVGAPVSARVRSCSCCCSGSPVAAVEEASGRMTMPDRARSDR